ncbi:MAG TPA: hypothetical protein PK802_07195 [Candidatus Cloacimonadota bacterium]|jgi:hypothetical protein|nr:hypothetical protein [Candidatus Cloacimonadota bacterium]HOG31086.1 hypothetical protein [Candidatus Cloacimonadota bacterium]HOR59067.1 hypothetical protein [Candidatus Cloacimonadota bacterium]HPB09457.1 hypothetical protein [Candidatus Cloacimonadota bacterium]HPL23448.1 hypothetical protein [Candidatus Cloacimonadota bacterium]
MMALNSVAAKEGGMRGMRESKHNLFMEASNVWHGWEQSENLLKTGCSISLKKAPKIRKKTLQSRLDGENTVTAYY